MQTQHAHYMSRYGGGEPPHSQQEADHKAGLVGVGIGQFQPCNSHTVLVVVITPR